MAWLDALAPIVRRAVCPPSFVVALATPAIAAMMAWVFLLGNENSPLAYAAYVASAYLLTVLCIWIARNFSPEGIRDFVSRSAIGKRILDDKGYRRRFSISGGLIVDVAWAMVSLFEGLCGSSVWLAVYYLLLAAMRGALLSRMRRPNTDGEGGDRAISRLCGALLLLSAFVLSGIVYLVTVGEEMFSYGDVLIYAVAAYAFYSLSRAVLGYLRQHGRGSVLAAVYSRVNLALALASIFTLESALLAEFGATADAGFQFITSAATGAAVVVALAAMGVRSIVCAEKSTQS